MATDLNRSIKIYIDGSDAQKGVEDIEKAIASLTERLNGLNASEKDYNAQSAKLKKEIDQQKEKLEDWNRKVRETDRVLKNLSGATYNELLTVQRQVKKELKDLKPGTEQYNATLEQSRRITQELTRVQREMRGELGQQGGTFSRMAGFVNKFGATLASAAAAVTGLTLTARKSVQDYAQMEEAMANVRKYTGMTTDEVKNLNESLKQMDTRTPREKLNQLAGDAGRLGITSKEAILEFVDAADKINVALGEDLGEDAVKNIGKLAQMFGEDKALGLRGAMLATGSAINEVAQSCSAAEPYLVDFTARVAGVAHQAGVSQADIIGFAASMDENMLQSEKSSTAFQKVLMKMFTDSAKFANAAGLDVKQFSDLVRNDAMEALLTFAEALGKKGGLYDLAPIFGDLKTEGAGVASMLSVMAGKADEIRSRQQLANQAYREGTSILKEYDVQNNTVQAGLDKAKKGFLEVSIQLGEKLQPAMTHVISGTSALVRGLNVLISFCSKNITVLASLAVAYGTLNVLLGVTAAKTKVVTLWNEKVAASFKKLWAAIQTNPYALIIAVLAAIGTAIYKLATRATQATEQLKAVKGVIRDMNKELLTEQTQLDSLFAALKRANPMSKERAEIIKEINERYGQYLPYLLTEKSTLDDISDAYKSVNEKLVENIVLKNRNKAIDEVAEIAAEKQAEAIESVRSSIENKLKNSKLANMAVLDLKQITTEFYNAGGKWEDAFEQAYHSIKVKYFGKNSMSGVASQDMAAYVKSYYTMQNDIQAINKKFANWMPQKPANQLEEVTVTASNPNKTQPTDVTTNSGGNEKTAKEILADEKQRIAEMKALREQELTEIEAAYNAQNELQQTMLETGKMTQQEYQIWQVAYAHATAQKRLEVEEKYQQQFHNLQLTNQDLAVKAEQEAGKRVVQQQSKANNARLKAESTYQKNLDAIRKMFEKADTSPESQLKTEYDTKLALLESYYKAALQYAREHGQNEKDIHDAYTEAKRNIDEEYEKNKRNLAKQTSRELKALQGNDISQSFTAIFSNIKKLQDELKNANVNFGNVLQSIQAICNSVLNGLSSAFSTFKQIEIDNIEAKYDAEIEAAGDNTEKIEQLEEEKAQAKLDIEKKYADVDFAVKCSQIIANTALAIMMAYAELGPVAGAIAAALMGATGAIQLAAAAAEREKVKNMTLSGSSSSSGTGRREATGNTTTQYAEGRYDVIGAQDGKTYTGVPYIGEAETGIVRQPALISENGAELIVNADDLRRLQHHVNYPLVVDAINESRRGGTPVPQHSAGSYAAVQKPKGTAVAKADETAAALRELTATLSGLQRDGIPAAVSLTDLQRKQDLQAKSRKIGSKHR